MGTSKRLMEEQEEKRAVALQIAIDASVLKRCELHEDAVLDCGSDVEDAYKLGNSRFTKGELSDVFGDRTDMTDAIKEVVGEHLDECPYCAKWRDE